MKWSVIGQFEIVARKGDRGPVPSRQAAKKTANQRDIEEDARRSPALPLRPFLYTFGTALTFKTIAQELGFAYVIRIRGDIYVTSAKGERRKAAQWVGQGGRSRTLRGAQVTDEHHLEVGRVVCVHDRKMKEPWCLVASESTVGTRTLIRYYGKRWGIETSFRDIKDH